MPAERKKIQCLMIKERSLPPNSCDYSGIAKQSLRDHLEAIESRFIQKIMWPLRYAYLPSCLDEPDLSSSQMSRLMYDVSKFGLIKKDKVLHVSYGQRNCNHVIAISADGFRAFAALAYTYNQFDPDPYGKIPWRHIVEKTKKDLGNHYLVQEINDEFLEPVAEEFQLRRITKKEALKPVQQETQVITESQSVLNTLTHLKKTYVIPTELGKNTGKFFPRTSQKIEDVRSEKAVSIGEWERAGFTTDKELLTSLIPEIIMKMIERIPNNRDEELSLTRVNKELVGTVSLTNSAIVDLLYMRASLRNLLTDYSIKLPTLDFSYGELRDALYLINQLILRYKLTSALDVYTRLKKRDLEQKRIQE